MEEIILFPPFLIYRAMKYLLSVLCIVMWSVTIAQNASTDLKRNVLRDQESVTGVIYTRMINTLDNMEKEEAFLLNDYWQNINITDNSGTTLTIDSANYNIEADLFLFYKNGELFHLYPEKINEVKIGRKVFKAMYSKSDDKVIFLEKLSEGELDLFKRYSIASVSKNTHPMGIKHNNEKPDKKLKHTFYYYDKSDKGIQKLPKKKKKFLMLFKNKKNRLLEFIRSNDLSNKNEDDLLLIFDHYNLDLMQ